MAWGIEDTTYSDMLQKSYEQWLEEMAKHEDLAVRDGVRLATEYMNHLKTENERLRSELELKNDYLKKMKGKIKK